MSAFQIIAIVIFWTINMLDGFDVLAIAFTAPEVAKDWGLTPAELGIVFSAGLFGMMAGALLLAPLGDYLGRRATILGGLVTITVGMYLTAFSVNVTEMVALRAVTGLGIGTILASLTTMAAEYSSDKRRNLSISFMQAGYPVGGILGGVVSVFLIRHFGWQSVFIFGAVASGSMLPLVYFFMPESVSFLLDKQPRNALRKVNAIARRLGAAPMAELPARAAHAATTRVTVAALLARDRRLPTLALWASFFFTMVALYFILSWTPKVVADAGLSADQGRLAGTLINIGGAITMTLLGWLSVRTGLRRIIQVYLVAAAVVILLFGYGDFPAAALMLLAFLMGLEMAGLVGLYSVAARLYPTEMRNTGVGWAIGIGRWGAIFGPAAAGWMISLGLERWVYFLLLGSVPALLAAVAVGYTGHANDGERKRG